MKANPLKRIRPWMWILGAIVLLVVALIILMNIDTTPPKTTVVATGKIDGDFEYTLYSDNTAEITKYLGSAAAVTVPAAISLAVKVRRRPFFVARRICAKPPDEEREVYSEAKIPVSSSRIAV